MANEKKIPDAKKDLIWVLVFFIILGFVWYYTGGPSRPSSKSGLFLISPSETTREEVSVPTETIIKEELPKKEFQRESVYKFKVDLLIDQNIKKFDPQEEHVTIQASFANSESINISNWSLENGTGLRINIGQATLLLKTGDINLQQNILLAPGEKAIVASGESPLGTGFKLNKCTGYLEQMQDFFPPLFLDCPDPINDEILPANLDNSCIDYIRREFEKCKAYFTYPSNLSSACQDYINERINYRGCVQWHKNDPNFYKSEWRVYLNKKTEFWDNDRETVILYDENNKIVDWEKY